MTERTRTAERVTEMCLHCGVDASDNSFDRSLCACGAMHTFHNGCGRPLDDCPYDVGAEVALTPADLGWLRGLARYRVRKQRRRVDSYEGEDSWQADRLRANLARMEATLARLEPLVAEDWEWENDEVAAPGGERVLRLTKASGVGNEPGEGAAS